MTITDNAPRPSDLAVAGMVLQVASLLAISATLPVRPAMSTTLREAALTLEELADAIDADATTLSLRSST